MSDEILEELDENGTEVETPIEDLENSAEGEVIDNENTEPSSEEDTIIDNPDNIENTEIPSEEVETPTEDDVIEENIIEIPQRVNPFCVIGKDVRGQYSIRDIQTNSSWSKNPYAETYAVVPDDMVPDILETRGFCDIELNEDGTEVVSFTAREIPEIPQEDPAPSLDDRVSELEDNNLALSDDILNTQLALTEQYENNLILEEDLLNTQMALTEQYEANILLEEDLLNTQMALTEQYEYNLTLEETINNMQKDIDELKAANLPK